MKKIAVLSLLVASFTFGAHAAERDDEKQYDPAINSTVSEESQKISPEERDMIQDKINDESKDKKECQEKECDEEKMEEEQNVEES